MNKLEQKTKPKTYDVGGSDFRVREYDGKFEIQRKEIIKKTTGILWWKKTTEETTWKYVDNYGNCLWAFYMEITISNLHEKIGHFTDLQSAFDKIDVMIAGAKYHYH